MKLFIALSLVLSSFYGLQEKELIKIEYKAITRGTSKSIIISKAHCFIEILGEKDKLKIHKKQ